MNLPVAASVVIVVESDGRYLMIEEERGPGARSVWYFPSGALDAGETLAEAAKREVLEETGYAVEPTALIAIDHGAFREPGNLLWWRFVIAAHLGAPVPRRVEESGILNVEWCDTGQIEARRLRNADALGLCRLHGSMIGLSLNNCRLSEDGALEGFFA